jgi:hypothetical protein
MIAVQKEIDMSKKIGMLLSAAFVLGALLSAAGATRSIVVAANAAAASADVIPGYDKDGQTVDVPNPDRH